ncbi:cytochrome P450 [Streptomyces sp. NPDC053048]|uniref:cytochrome P450 n=1 Tax=Streptomyces sp. NPDC053048 TaxID=3365694 RepID=UPI0037D4C38D
MNDGDTVRTGEALPEFPVARECPFHPPAGYEELRTRGAVTKVRLPGGRTAWAVTGHAEARALLADPTMSSDHHRPNFPFAEPAMAALKDRSAGLPVGALVRTDPPEHTTQRRMLIPSFTVRRNAALRPDIQRIVDERLDAMLDHGSPADLVSAFALPVASGTICELLGVPYEDHDFFEEQARRRFTPGQVVDAFTALADYLDGLIRAKEKSPGDGLLDDLVTEQVVPGRLERSELVRYAMTLLLAGHDTSAHMIALSVLTLLEHPAQLAALRAEPELLPGAIEELLRYLSIIGSLARVATRDIEIGGRLIRAGDGVLIASGAVNYDAAHFDHPRELDVRRSARNHVAFGYGVHQCIGQNLARVEMDVALRTLFERVPSLRLAVPAEEVPVKQGLFFGLEELMVAWDGSGEGPQT